MPRKTLISWQIFGVLLVLLVGGWLGGCRETAVAPSSLSPTQASVPNEPTTDPAVEATSARESEADSIRDITILYTNDEHGWMAGLEAEAGAANLVGLWRSAEGYQADDRFLLLSGGDMWTGPALSTWFQGESMAEVMDAMGYAAAAVGNHEFDFGLDVLKNRAAESDFPFLSANIRYKADGSTPEDWGIRPYTIVTVNEIQVGIIGLTTRSTPTTTNPVNVALFDFIDYEIALREVVPQVKADGAEMLVVAAHICQAEMEELAQDVSDLGIQVMGGGHCHEELATEVDGMVLLEAGTALAAYAYATFQFDTASDTVVSVDFGVRSNSGGTSDPEVASIVQRWQDEAGAELNRTIGYSDQGVARRSQEMQSLITEAWLWAYPAADVAITNLGGMRADLPPGDITLADVVGVMPFENVIVELQLTGEQLEVMLGQDSAAVGGVYRSNFRWYLKETGEELDTDTVYTVLVNDFMYAGGDDYALLAVYDPGGYNTSINWRQPVIDWILAQDSSPDRPIDEAIQALVGE